jgi:hypothetical protein
VLTAKKKKKKEKSKKKTKKEEILDTQWRNYCLTFLVCGSSSLARAYTGEHDYS